MQLVKAGAKQAQPYADLGTEVLAGGERGLLSIAFPPDYAVSGLAYVYLTAAGGEIQIRELPALRQPRPRGRRARPRRAGHPPYRGRQPQRRAARVRAADGMLYAGVGDGGNANDTPVSDAENPGSLLGKILRIDPRQGAGQPYTVPVDNPFGTPVWAYGLRNPWRFSFDRETGALLAGDVGQGVREEIDVIVRGGDYGWRCWEGSHPHPVGSEQPQLGAAVPGRDAPDGADPRARPRRRLLLDHRRRGRARSRCADPRRALSVRRLLRARPALGAARRQRRPGGGRAQRRLAVVVRGGCLRPRPRRVARQGRSAGCRTARRRPAARRGRWARRPHPRPRRRAPPTCARAGSA